MLQFVGTFVLPKRGEVSQCSEQEVWISGQLRKSGDSVKQIKFFLFDWYDYQLNPRFSTSWHIILKLEIAAVRRNRKTISADLLVNLMNSSNVSIDTFVRFFENSEKSGTLFHMLAAWKLLAMETFQIRLVAMP